MMTKETIYQHFNANEREFVEKLQDLIERVEAQYSCQLTGFLDPRQQDIARSVLGHAGIKFFSSFDCYPLEYARFLLAPDYYELDSQDFEMSLIEVTYQGKFSQLSHSQILGSLLNGLGLKRQVIGDILVQDGYAQVVVDAKMADYMISHTDKMARTGVHLRLVDFGQLIKAKEMTTSYHVLVSSQRLDKLVAVLTKLSRQQAQALIISGKVKQNYREMEKPTQVVQVGDLLSIRGFGRYRLTDDLGLTKTGKHKLMIEETLKK